MNDVQLFELYLNIKRHFTEKKFHISKDRFKIRDGQRIPSIIGRLRSISKYVKDNKASYISFLVSNFVYGSENDLYELGDKSYENYDKWRSYRNSFTYRIIQENEFLQAVLAKNKLNFDQIFDKITKDEIPPILTLFLSKKVSIEFMVYLERRKKYLTEWLNDDTLMLLYGTEINRIYKAEYFVKHIEKKVGDKVCE